jgi:hypothetical protein
MRFCYREENKGGAMPEYWRELDETISLTFHNVNILYLLYYFRK